MQDLTNTVGLHFRFTKTAQSCWGTKCFWATSLRDEALTCGAGARAPMTPALATGLWTPIFSHQTNNHTYYTNYKSHFYTGLDSLFPFNKASLFLPKSGKRETQEHSTQNGDHLYT